MPICKFLPPHAESHHRLEEINSNTTYTLFPASCMTLHKVVIFISNKLPHACGNMRCQRPQVSWKDYGLDLVRNDHKLAKLLNLSKLFCFFNWLKDITTSLGELL